MISNVLLDHVKVMKLSHYVLWSYNRFITEIWSVPMNLKQASLLSTIITTHILRMSR